VAQRFSGSWEPASSHATIEARVSRKTTLGPKGEYEMAISIEPIQPGFGAEVAGVDCGKPLSASEAAVIEAGMDQYAVLVFRDQPLTDQQQIDFTRHFGELEGYNTPGHIRKKDESRLGPGIADFSNLDKSGEIMSDQDRVWFFKLGDRLWHSDSSFRPVPA
jgi:alpha-ketoglutarate-dependent 2,4-dichlorophenoxyacetate dioxygenase